MNDWLRQWWKRRAVPISQGHIRSMLESKGLLGPEDFLLKNLGLSLTVQTKKNQKMKYPIIHPMALCRGVLKKVGQYCREKEDCLKGIVINIPQKVSMK